MHDLKQLAKDATGILAPDFYIEARVGRENHRGDCVRALSYWASRNERADELLKRLAAFVRDLTDETPLTVERLVERGYEKVNYGDWKFQHDNIRAYPSIGTWTWYYMPDRGTPQQIYPPPRTVGELAMIELLMEGR